MEITDVSLTVLKVDILYNQWNQLYKLEETVDSFANTFKLQAKPVFFLLAVFPLS